MSEEKQSAADDSAEKPYKPVGKVEVLAEAVKDGFVTRVKQDAKRVWKEIEAVVEKASGKKEKDAK